MARSSVPGFDRWRFPWDRTLSFAHLARCAARMFANLVDKFVGDIRQNVHATGIFTRVQYPRVQTLEHSEKTFTKAYEEFEKKIPAARRALEIEFRKILGVEQDGNYKASS